MKGQWIYLILKPLSLCIYLTYFLFFICLIKKSFADDNFSNLHLGILYGKESVCNCVSLHELDNWSILVFNIRLLGLLYYLFACVTSIFLIFGRCKHLIFNKNQKQSLDGLMFLFALEVKCF